MADIEVKVDQKLLQEALRLYPDRLFVSFRKRMLSFHRRFMSEFKRTKFRNAKSAVQTRSGSLVRSFNSEARGSDINTLTVESFSAGNPYARIQEEGGTITPKKTWLTIPLDAARTASGVARGNARSFTDTFFIMTKKKKLLLVQKRGDEIVPLFILVKKVTLKPRLGFVRMWRTWERKIGGEINLAAKEALAGGDV